MITYKANKPKQLPLRLTKTLLAASIEKLRDGSAAYETAAVLWAAAIPVILPNILALVRYVKYELVSRIASF